MAITTAMPNSFKSELFSGAHCFGAPVTTTGNTHTTTLVDSIASLAGVSVGMLVAESHGDLPAGCVVADITAAGSIVVAPAATGGHTGGTLTFTLASLYASLYRLEARGWIRGRWIERPGTRRRRYYRITDGGRRVLAAQREDWGRFVMALGEVAGVKFA